MKFRSFEIDGPLEILPERYGDERGYFSEIFRLDAFSAQAGHRDFVQENESLSRRVGTVRGFHYQTRPFAQGKLVRCVAGAILDVAVDIRQGSPTFGKWVSAELSRENGRQLWVPAGFAHGFCTVEPDTIVCYKVTHYYNPECDKGLAWNDPAIGVEWSSLANPETLSAKDRVQPKLAELPAYFADEA